MFCSFGGSLEKLPAMLLYKIWTVSLTGVLYQGWDQSCGKGRVTGFFPTLNCSSCFPYDRVSLHNTPSPVLTCAIAARPHGLHCIQWRFGGSWTAPQVKGIFPPIPCITPQPALWQFSDLHQKYSWCKSRRPIEILGGSLGYGWESHICPQTDSILLSPSLKLPHLVKVRMTFHCFQVFHGLVCSLRNLAGHCEPNSASAGASFCWLWLALLGQC